MQQIVGRHIFLNAVTHNLLRRASGPENYMSYLPLCTISLQAHHSCEDKRLGGWRRTCWCTQLDIRIDVERGLVFSQESCLLARLWADFQQGLHIPAHQCCPSRTNCTLQVHTRCKPNPSQDCLLRKSCVQDLLLTRLTKTTSRWRHWGLKTDLGRRRVLNKVWSGCPINLGLRPRSRKGVE